MQIPLYIDGFIIDSKDRLPLYLEKLYHFKCASITINDISCLFMFEDFNRIMSNISKSLTLFQIWASKPIKKDFNIRVYGTYKQSLMGAINNSIITINNEHICEHWCNNKIKFEINKLSKTSCCKEIEQNLHDDIIFNQYCQVNKDVYKNLVFSNFIKKIEFYDDNSNPLLVFFGLSFGNNTYGLLATANQILENIPDPIGIKLPIIKNNDHYRSLSTDKQYCISQQIHAFDVLKNNWGILPIVIDQNNLNILDIAIHESNRRLYSNLYEHDLIDLFKLYYRKINKESCPQFIEVRGGGSINKDAIFIRRSQVKKDLTSQEVSHYNYILKLIKGSLNKRYY